MPDLVAFLRARLDEDEELAQTVADIEPVYPHIGDAAIEESAHMATQEGCTEKASEHILRWSPSRVLAEVEAKGRIIEMHVDGSALCDRCAGSPQDCPTLRLLASPYADHPDFDPEWLL